MPRATTLDAQWQHLMLLLENERKFEAKGGHARLLKVIRSDIDHLADEMGYKPRRIASRDFRAERENGRIVRILND
jgi:hypothetical protein